ncbi:MAG: cation:dicarboxylase symporter family transporter [Gemmatimonadetes bacterium]|nr:cation:dicarboxylase symporter family transporter [Gemmatimonadota bacterium]
MRVPGSDASRVLVALAAAIVSGMLVAASGNEGASRAAVSIQPVGVLWVNAIRMTVIPLVVSLLITGIGAAADVASLGRLGARTLGIFGAMLVGSAVVTLAVAVPLFTLFPAALVGKVPLPPGAQEAAADVAKAAPSGVTDFVMGLIPANPIAAAASGNMVALIVFTGLLALALARGSAPSREPLLAFFKSLGDAMTRLVGWIIALAPIAVFALMLPLAVQAGSALVGAVGFYVLAVAVTALAVTALCYPLAGHAGGVRALARSLLPTQLIGISTSSSVACLPAMVRSADGLGIPSRVSGFVLPLAVSVFKPAAPVMWIVGALFIGKFYGVDLSPGALAVVAVASVTVSFAAPGVPRGAFLLLTPLFEAVGLPAEGIGVLIAIDLVPDMCATVVNVTGDVTAAAWASRAEARG